MKRNVVKSSALVGAMTLTMMFAGLRTGSLKEIAKPYLGVYECVEAKLGGKDCLGPFEELSLELKADGSFYLYYQERNRDSRREKGQYRYDPEKKTLTLVGGGEFIKREFPLENGILTVTVRVGDKLLNMQFEQK